MDKNRLLEIIKLANNLASSISTLGRPSADKEKIFSRQLRSLVGVCMQGLDLNPAIKDITPPGKIGELYHAVRYLHGVHGFSANVRNDVKNSVTTIANILERAAKDIKELESKRGSNMQASTKEIWQEIERDFDVSKKTFGKKINFVKDKYKRNVIFRDVEHAYYLACNGFSKPAVILAGGVIEELLRLYLDNKGVRSKSDSFNDYIKTCEAKGLLKMAIHKLSDSVRHFRNIVHLSKETSSKITISKATAKGAVSSIFTIANDF